MVGIDRCFTCKPPMISSAGSPCWLLISIIETEAPASIKADAARIARTSYSTSLSTCIHTVRDNVLSNVNLHIFIFEQKHFNSSYYIFMLFLIDLRDILTW